METSGVPAAEPVALSAVLSPRPDHAQASIEPGAKPASALTPPTSEEMNHELKVEQEESDLSELEMDDEDEEEIYPDHYWDGGKIPVFKPTMDQFRSFKKFMDKIDKYGMKSGIVKVIPPKEWRDSLPALDEYVKRIKIKNPITQEFNGTFGTYTQQNVEKQRSYNLPEWKTLTEETQHQPPAKRGERRRNQEKVVRGGGSMRGRASAGISPAAPDSDESPRTRKKPGRPRRTPLPTESIDSDDDTHDSGSGSGRAHVPPTSNPLATKPMEKKPAKARGRPTKNGAAGQAKSVTSRRLNNTSEAADYVDEKAFKNFDYRMHDLDEFTPERCAELETQYWKSLAFNQPMYAADMPGSLFDDNTTSWNVAKLENLLDILGTKVPGVNTAYLYMGMWKATFAWHLEDVDLYSINYIHFGAPKQWYSISQEDARKFEGAMKTNWPMDAKNCDQFLRHKTYLISPDVLQKQHNVKVNKLVHYEGEFVITFPYGYHSGYNIGYNCAESVNFATESWLEYGRIARKCNCEADNVWVDVSEIERKLRGEPTPEYYEETDDDDDGLSDEEDGNLPSPPASVKGKVARGKKRKREAKEEKPKKRKKIRIRIRALTREPCAMCPNDNPWEPLLPTDNGKKAHRCCVLFTPETWLERDSNGLEKACGVATIDRARLELKCNLCRSKRGACFQCSSKKCTRAFHATCALAAGVQIDAGMVPTFGEDGTEYFEEGYDFRCRYHRPKMPKNLTVEMLENSKRVHNYAKDLKFNDVIQAQYFGADVFAGLVVENRPNEMSVIVDVIPEGDRIEVEYKWICVLNPDDSQRPKPSSNAIPMPAGMNKKEVSVNNRQDGVPEQGQPFHDNPDYKFHDFYNPDMPPPNYLSVRFQVPNRLRVNVDAPDQLYYYLPIISTEAKCFFTDQVDGTAIATQANFLDRVQAQQPSYTVQRQSLAAAPVKHVAAPPSAPLSTCPRPSSLSATSASGRSKKPYAYKPKDAMGPNVMWGIDPQALATQRSFLADAAGRSSEPTSRSGYHVGNPTRTGTPLRSFPKDHYYSAEMLPAAYPGEYSTFREVARRQSHGAQSLEMPSYEGGEYKPQYHSVTQQKAQLKQGGAPTVPMMGGSAPASVGLANPSGSSSSRPSSSAHSHQSPLVAPLTPATTASSTSKSSETAPGYLDNIRQYPYLLNSYLRKNKTYESPYPIGGGFSSPYQPLAFNKPHEPGNEKRRIGTHTPSNSIASLGDPSGRVQQQQWTPPSKMWDQAGLSNPTTYVRQRTPPPAPAQTPRTRPLAATYQTPSEFQQSFQQSLPSTASRDGVHARMLRDQGYPNFGPFAPHAFAHPRRDSSGQAYDPSKAWQSPKAPTPSPLSDPNTPGLAPGPIHMSNPLWNLQQADGSQPMHRQSSAGYGPMLPQMHPGNEPWRYN